MIMSLPSPTSLFSWVLFNAISRLSGLLLVVFSGQIAFGPPCGAVEPIARSFGTILDHPVDRFSQPHYRHRVNHRGWEVRTDTFAVMATTRRADAEWALRQIEKTWEQVGRFADHWTGVHHHPSFGIGSVFVLVDDQPAGNRGAPLPTMPDASGTSMIYLNVAPGAPSLKEQLPALQRAAVHAFLYVSQCDGKLPQWFQDGLAAYFDDEDGDLAAVWVRYLIEGDDAQHLPDLFTAVRETIRQAEGQPRAVRHPESHAWRRPGLPSAAERTPLDALIRTHGPLRQIDGWFEDHDVDQPSFDPLPHSAPKQIERLREMLVILKLARRFPMRPRSTVQPRIIAYGADGMKDISVQPTGARSWEPAELCQRLTFLSTENWATRDADGSVLLSSEHNRLEQLFGLREQRYRTEFRDSQTVLVHRWDPNTVLEAWLEENPNNSRRPIAHTQVKSHGKQQRISPRKSHPAGEKDPQRSKTAE